MEMRDLGAVGGIVAGALGEPGDRTFLVEIRTGGDLEWFLLEKRQVAALALEAAQLLESTGFADAGAGQQGATLSYPTEVTFRISDIELSYREGSDLIEMVFTSVSDDDPPVRIGVTPAQLDRMARGAAEAVQSGRPPCARCGLAMDPDGHACPVDNGDLRAHRP